VVMPELEELDALEELNELEELEELDELDDQPGLLNNDGPIGPMEGCIIWAHQLNIGGCAGK